MRVSTVIITVGMMLSLALAAESAKSNEPEFARYQIDFKSPNREWFIFITSGLKEKRMEIGGRIFKLLEEAAPKDEFHFFECPSHEHIVSITIGESASRAVRMRKGDMKKGLGKIRALFKEPKENGSLEIDLPRVPSSVASVRNTRYPANVVLCGDPIYEGGLHHGGFSMRRGVAPTLPMLTKSYLSHLSPYYQGVPDFPPHALVAILAHRSDWGVEHMHQAAVEVTWRRMLHEKGNAHLVYITDSVESAFNLRGSRIVSGYAAQKVVEEEFGMKPATMQSALELSEEVPLTVFLGRPRDKPPVYEIVPPQNVEAIFERALNSTTHTALAARWIMDSSYWTFTDVDWHLSHPDYEELLAYDSRVTPYGRLKEDVRYGVSTKNGDFGNNWEVVVVRNEALESLDAWLNVYCAVGPIRVHVAQIGNGVRKDAYYTIPSRFGDEAMDINKRRDSRAWYPISLPIASRDSPDVKQSAASKRVSRLGKRVVALPSIVPVAKQQLLARSVRKTSVENQSRAPITCPIPWAWDAEACPPVN